MPSEIYHPESQDHLCGHEGVCAYEIACVYVCVILSVWMYVYMVSSAWMWPCIAKPQIIFWASDFRNISSND